MRAIHILLTCTLLNAGISFAQPKHSIDELKKCSRDSLIKMAIHIINDTAFHAAYYEDVTVKYNKESFYVVFSNNVRLKSKKYCYYDAVDVELCYEIVSKSLTGECKTPIVAFYRLTTEMKNNIAFVFDAINKSDEIGHLPGNKVPEGTVMTIIETKRFFEVEVSDDDTFSTYKVDRATGKISDASHKHYSRDGIPDEWTVIK